MLSHLKLLLLFQQISKFNLEGEFIGKFISTELFLFHRCLLDIRKYLKAAEA